jgi:hypothetical protein
VETKVKEENMRKVLTLFFAAVLVLAFSWPVQAAGKYLGAPDFKFRGWWAMWGWSNDNVVDFDDDRHDHNRAVYQRFRWWFDASFDGKYGGTFGMEMNWIWGVDAGENTIFRSGLGALEDGDNFPQVDPGWPGVFGDDQVDINRLRHAYIWFMVPQTPLKVTVGLQSFILEPDIIMHGSNAVWFGVRADMPIIKGLLNVSAGWMKQDEGAGLAQNSDDSDYYFVNFTGALAKWLSYGFYHQWLHVRENGFTALDAPVYGNWRNGAGFHDVRQSFLGTHGDYLWHGLHMSARFPWFYARLHGNVFWGDKDDDRIIFDLDRGQWRRAPEDDPFGYAFVGRAGVTLGPFEIGLKGWYFSGNDEVDALVDLNNGGLADARRYDDWNRWSSPDAFFAPFEIMYLGGRQWAQGNSMYVNGPGGSAALCLESDWQVTKKLLLDLLAGYIWATEKEDKPFQRHLSRIPNTALYNENDDLGLGFEVDLRATYKIYDHLSLDLVFAYLFADDGLDFADGEGGFEESDDAYELFWRLLYTF